MPYLSSASLVSSINSGQHGDALLICTGTDMKWVSESAMIERGQFVFLDMEDESLELPSLEHTTCPLVVLADHATDDDAIPVINFFNIDNFTRIYAEPQPALPTFEYHTTHPSRAPPFLS